MGDPVGFTLGQLARAVGATLEGDPAQMVTGVAPLETAGPNQISFLVDSRYREAVRASRAGALLVPLEMRDLPVATLRCRAPQQALIHLLTLFHPPPSAVPGIHGSALVAPGARVDPSASIGPLTVVESGAAIGPRVSVAPLVYIGPHAEIGEASIIHSHVVIRERVTIGRRVIVHAGAVIGGDGFGYAFEGGAHRKIPQVGEVLIEDDVEIGANTTIDRATLGKTVIRRGTKIDNLVQIGHNVEVGEHGIIVAQVGIAGSCRLGRGVVLGGQAGIADHVTIGDGAMLGAQAGVTSDVEAGAKLFGTWARPVTQARRIWIAEGQLPDLVRRVRGLEQRIGRLEASTRAPQKIRTRRARRHGS